MRGVFFRLEILRIAGEGTGGMGPGLRRGDGLGRFADVTDVPGSFVSDRQTGYFVFVWWFLKVAGKREGAVGPAFAVTVFQLFRRGAIQYRTSTPLLKAMTRLQSLRAPSR